MKKISSKILIISTLAIAIVLILIQTQAIDNFKTKSFEEKRDEILSEIDITLKEATESGKYKCCMKPPCKMCLLGNWIWKDGICRCDIMIEQNEWDNVCPECKGNIKEESVKCPV
jgi:hypothetical protein